MPVLAATRVADAHITINGAMEEKAWGATAVATRFTQFEPDEGEPATQRTEARVLYGATALFVFMRAHDTSPGEIASQLTRRDQQSYSDLLGVVIDSYFDRRTAFQFVVNPAGVKQDMYRFDDTSEDTGWDAVWDVATTRDEGGWSRRIPHPVLPAALPGQGGTDLGHQLSAAPRAPGGTFGVGAHHPRGRRHRVAPR